MFATYEVQQIGEWFSKPTRIGAGRIRRRLVFCVALLLALGGSGQIARAAGKTSPTATLQATTTSMPSETPMPANAACRARTP